MRIAFNTLGCKINQYETDALLRNLTAQGNSIVPFEEDADIYIINTCTVTAKTDYRCRQVIRSAVRRAKGAQVIVTGCYAETRPDEIRQIAGVDLVIGNGQKMTIPDRLLKASFNPGPAQPQSMVRRRTRGFLKIQDGCDNGCSYCIVPLARGKPRSTPWETVISEFEGLVTAGCPEVVLSGIHIGKYGVDLSSGQDLTMLLRTLLEKRCSTRIRLSSVEPREITADMIGMLGRGLCRHLHIPLQSGDDGILKAMRRNYSSGFYQDLLGSIANAVPGIALGADVIVGFPGEGETEFENTYQLIKNSPLTHLHVFMYSPRPGTVAAEMTPLISEHIKKQRSEALRALGKTLNAAFRKKSERLVLKAVVEDDIDASSGFMTGITDNYIRLNINGATSGLIGKEISVRVISAKETATMAQLM